MTKNFLKNTLAFMMLCGFGLFITSCSDSDEDTVVTVETTENFVNQSVFSLQTEVGKCGLERTRGNSHSLQGIEMKACPISLGIL